MAQHVHCWEFLVTREACVLACSPSHKVLYVLYMLSISLCTVIVSNGDKSMFDLEMLRKSGNWSNLLNCTPRKKKWINQGGMSIHMQGKDFLFKKLSESHISVFLVLIIIDTINRPISLFKAFSSLLYIQFISEIH